MHTINPPMYDYACYIIDCNNAQIYVWHSLCSIKIEIINDGFVVDKKIAYIRVKRNNWTDCTLIACSALGINTYCGLKNY